MGNQFDDFINEKAAGKSDAEVAAELKALELEEKRLDLELKREAVALHRGRRQAQLEATQQKMQSLRNFIAQRAAQQAKCNHRKGGIGPEALINGEGSSPMYCVIKHRLPSGNYFVICSRCGKEWHPAEPYNVEGGRVVAKDATPGWEEAVRYPTDNTPSVSSTFFFKEEKIAG